MNERIQELKHQAFLWCDENIAEQYSHETGYGDAWEDKFAELIVRECAHKLLSFASIHECRRYDVEIPEYVQGNVYGLRCGADLIKQHFGVE